MNTVKEVHSFMEEHDTKKAKVEFYHHDISQEPTATVEDNVNWIVYDEKVDEHGDVLTLFLDRTSFSFTDKNHHLNISDEKTVVISSKHDTETYWIIEFS